MSSLPASKHSVVPPSPNSVLYPVDPALLNSGNVCNMSESSLSHPVESSELLSACDEKNSDSNNISENMAKTQLSNNIPVSSDKESVGTSTDAALEDGIIPEVYIDKAIEEMLTMCSADGEPMTEDDLLKVSEAMKFINGQIPKLFQCGHCQKEFRYKQHLQTHMLSLHSDAPKQFSCPVCAKKFRLKHHLTLHFRQHTGERPYKCETCGATFTSSSNLKKHQAVHSNARKFRCKVCLKEFKHFDHLKRHRRNCHEDLRSYSCEFCNAKFKRKEHLARHEEIHTKDNGNTYPCEYCNYVFTKKPAYDRHVKKCKEVEKHTDTETETDSESDDD